jgi:prevent-host-death family protein
LPPGARREKRSLTLRAKRPHQPLKSEGSLHARSSILRRQAHLPQLLDEVERGETIIITRHGRAIARLVPVTDRRREEIAKALAELNEFPKTMSQLTLAERLSARREQSRAAATAEIRAMSKGVTLGGQSIKDLIAAGRL